jgi:hypothetical protein
MRRGILLAPLASVAARLAVDCGDGEFGPARAAGRGRACLFRLDCADAQLLYGARLL